jgi:hypothetical protein
MSFCANLAGVACHEDGTTPLPETRDHLGPRRLRRVNVVAGGGRGRQGVLFIRRRGCGKWGQPPWGCPSPVVRPRGSGMMPRRGVVGGCPQGGAFHSPSWHAGTDGPSWRRGETWLEEPCGPSSGWLREPGGRRRPQAGRSAHRGRRRRASGRRRGTGRSAAGRGSAPRRAGTGRRPGVVAAVAAAVAERSDDAGRRAGDGGRSSRWRAGCRAACRTPGSGGRGERP